MQFIHELSGPTAPDVSKQRKIIVLEKKDANASLFVQHAHLSDNFRGFAGAHNSSGSGAIKCVD